MAKESSKTPPEQRLIEFRLERGLTQADLAEALGCSVAHLCAVERGHYKPSRRRIIQSMRRVVGIAPSEWFES